DGPRLIELAEELRRVPARDDERLVWRQAGRDEFLELLVQRRAVEDEVDGRVGAGEESGARSVQPTHDLLEDRELLALQRRAVGIRELELAPAFDRHRRLMRFSGRAMRSSS